MCTCMAIGFDVSYDVYVRGLSCLKYIFHRYKSSFLIYGLLRESTRCESGSISNNGRSQRTNDWVSLRHTFGEIHTRFSKRG
jgi:hypothetical protein